MYLYGASGHAKVIIDILKSQGKNILGLIDDNPSINELLGYKVYHNFGNLSPLIISIGDNKTRKKIAEHLSGICFETAVHASAILSDTCTIKEGTVVMQGAIIQSCSEIGRHCIINTGASVDHDCKIHDFVHISPHATLCGNATIGEGTWVGAGTVVIPGVKIGNWSIIGAGSVVTKDISDHVLAVGNPCKVIKQLSIP
jgi:sugar O-acyltransferase (sialic acid O-acetyltransferase NeuD family)